VSHGDIKPENFLVEESDENELNCLLIDFGSSTIQGQSRLPTINEPWNAVELENVSRSLSSDELAQTDIFSFGLVCLHILLPLESLENANLCLIRRPTHRDDDWAMFLRNLKRIKDLKTGQTLSARLIDVIEKSNVSIHLKSLLNIIVVSTIQPEPGQRTVPWAAILPHIEEYLSYR
jgi:serine/threonine protein kinase